MYKKSFLIFLIVMVPVFGLFSFEPEYLNRITFVNKTGADIWYVFLSPGDSDEWGFDILGSERVLEHNNLLSFYIFYPDSENYFDIMAIDEEGNTFVLFDQLVSDESEEVIFITEDNLKDENPGMQLLEVQFENQTEYEMFYLFISPSDSEMWGVDMMDDEQTLMSFDTLSLLAPYGDSEVSYDVLCVDSDNDEYQFSLNVSYELTDDYEVIRIPIEYSDLVQ
jgi:hypothetical protein